MQRIKVQYMMTSIPSNSSLAINIRWSAKICHHAKTTQDDKSIDTNSGCYQQILLLVLLLLLLYFYYYYYYYYYYQQILLVDTSKYYQMFQTHIVARNIVKFTLFCWGRQPEVFASQPEVSSSQPEVRSSREAGSFSPTSGHR